jgi:hypothetical protein
VRATAAAAIIELEDLLEPAPVETALCLPQPALDPKFERLKRRADASAGDAPPVEKRRRYGHQSSQQRLSQYAQLAADEEVTGAEIEKYE